MHARRLATVEDVIAVVSPQSDGARERLADWVDERGLALETVPVGEEIDDVYTKGRATLGVTIGGDGTFLEGIRVFAPKGVPVLGINTGTLSFLARVAPDDMEQALDELLRGRAVIDNRQQLHVEARGVDATGINEVLVQHVPPENPVDRKITRLHLFADDEYVGEYEGTGLAIATPTGSTGIAMSSGGPLHYPKDNMSLEVVPIQTHRMGVEPVVTSADTTLRVVTEGPADLLVDGGRSHKVLRADEVVTVTGAERPAHIVRTSYDDHFFTAIADKLGWNMRSVDDEGPRDAIEPAEPGEPETTVDRALRIGWEAAESVGEPLRELHGQVESIEYKSDKADIVTEADYQSEHIITTVIRNEFPDHGIRTEEALRYEADSEYLWLVDPLDGTGNFAHGNPNYAVSIALLEDDEPVVGVVYAPETDEMFAATTGGVARERETVLSTTDRDRVDESMLLSGYDPDGLFLAHFYQKARGVRRLGSAALNLCYLASGSADAVWEFDTYPWDVAAGLVIARAAGARLTDAEGEPYRLRLGDEEARASLLGSNGPLHDVLLDDLAGYEGAG
jgi:myo-inositol-1(or 4)-monophosphatase